LRKSRQREAILRRLKSTNIHPTAEWVYEQVKQEIPNISLGTVYRNLKSLNNDGEINELDYSGSVSHYDGNTKNHYHFRCEGCDQIIDLEDPVDEVLNLKVARKTGFQVANHRIEFRGLCLNCQS
jgi:Fur family peroxide stress response transcriptional regulator